MARSGRVPSGWSVDVALDEAVREIVEVEISMLGTKGHDLARPLQSSTETTTGV